MKKNNFDLYEIITERVIAQLEKGIIPWNRPWHGMREGAFNRVSKKPYSLLNQFLLKNTGEYASYKQWKELGGEVRKGEKGEMVVFWKMTPMEVTDKSGNKVQKIVPILRYYNVFHISQVDGVEPLTSDSLPVEHDPIPEAEDIYRNYVNISNGLTVQEQKSNKAYYSPVNDVVVVPCREQFDKIEEFYSTLFHELIHSTGHPSRLNRLETGAKAAFGSESYSKEELVAEIGSAGLLNGIGIETAETFKNSTAYIQSWIRVLKNDKRFIVSATGKAEKAIEYMLGMNNAIPANA